MAAETAGTSPAAASVAERDDLLATKLHVPRPRPGFLPRPRLLGFLAEGTGRDLVLVCTPPGFGKTSLLGDWARRSQAPVAWLSLDAGDNDPTRFWRYAAAALDGVRPGIGRQVAALLPLPRLRARGQFVELRERDLRFTPKRRPRCCGRPGWTCPAPA